MSKPRVALIVLVADDEKLIADSFATILNLSGHRATAVYSGEQAIQTAAELKPDLLISDVVMPGINGFEAAIRIRQILPRCRVILVSGHATTAELIWKADTEGQAFELFTKPVHPTVLLDRVNAFA